MSLRSSSQQPPGIYVKCDLLQPCMNPSRRICHLRAVPLGHVAEGFLLQPMEKGDIPLVAGGRYIVLDDSRPHWWLLRDSNGAEGHAPSNYLQDEENDGMETMR